MKIVKGKRNGSQSYEETQNEIRQKIKKKKLKLSDS